MRWLFCKHEHVRCIHGDEINNTMRVWRTPSYARVRCLDCGRALYTWPLPKSCLLPNIYHDID